MSHKIKNVWDGVYAEGGYGDLVPDHELADICQSLPAGLSIDVGAGEGRHSLWLASQGWGVVALDVSSVSIELLRAKAERMGMQINCIVGSVADYDFGTENYDLVVSTGVVLNFFRKSEGKAIIRRLIEALKPRGILYITVSTPNDPAYRRHRDKAVYVEDDSFFSEKTGAWITAYTIEDLKDCCRTCELLLALEKEIQDSHGEPHVHTMAYIAARTP